MLDVRRVDRFIRSLLGLRINGVRICKVLKGNVEKNLKVNKSIFRLKMK